MESENIKMHDSPLVSIIVITYNSSKYVLETLESARAQTYQNIELIVSDDSSTDNTVEICRQWIEENKDRFVRTELIAVEKNTGIPGNCNRGVNAAQGEWVKLIAGDDVLLPTCIEDLIEFTKKESNIRIVQSNIDHYRDLFDISCFINTRDLSTHPITNDSITAFQQYKLLLKGSVVNAPGTIIKKELLVEIGGYDTSYAIEDWPLWLKITRNNNKIYFLNKSTVNYRVHSNSISISKNKTQIYGNFYYIMRPFFKEQIIPNVSLWNRFTINYEFYVKLAFDKSGLNRNFFLLKVLLNLFLFNISFIKKLYR